MVQSLVCPRGICGAGAGVTAAVVIAAVPVPAAGTIVLGIVSCVVAALTVCIPVAGAVDEDDGGQVRGPPGNATARVCGIIVLATAGVGIDGAGGGTGAIFAVGVTCAAAGEVVACAGDRADADDEVAAIAAAAVTASCFTAMLGGDGAGAAVDVVSGGTTIVDDGVGCTVATLTVATGGDGGGGGGEDELGSLLVVDVAVCCSTAFRLGDGLRGWSCCCCCDSRDVAAAFGDEAAVGGGLAERTVGSVLMGLFSGGECTVQASHCSGPGSSVIK